MRRTSWEVKGRAFPLRVLVLLVCLLPRRLGTAFTIACEFAAVAVVVDVDVVVVVVVVVVVGAFVVASQYPPTAKERGWEEKRRDCADLGAQQRLRQILPQWTVA